MEKGGRREERESQGQHIPECRRRPGCARSRLRRCCCRSRSLSAAGPARPRILHPPSPLEEEPPASRTGQENGYGYDWEKDSSRLTIHTSSACLMEYVFTSLMFTSPLFRIQRSEEFYFLSSSLTFSSSETSGSQPPAPTIPSHVLQLPHLSHCNCFCVDFQSPPTLKLCYKDPSSPSSYFPCPGIGGREIVASLSRAPADQHPLTPKVSASP